MSSRLDEIAQRRAALVGEIATERRELVATLATARRSLALAGLGLMAGRLLQRHPWLRIAGAVGLAVLAGRRVLARLRVAQPG